MDKKNLSRTLLCIISIWAASTANAAVVTYQFSFTGEDLLGYNYVEGEDESSAADNSLFNGARKVHDDGNGNAARSYVESQHGAFDSWATSTTDKLTGLSLWGFGDLATDWGEDYKHKGGRTLSAPDNWVDEPTGWSGDPDENPNPYTNSSVAWISEGIDDALSFGAEDLASQTFSFQMSFNSNDWLYGVDDTNGAPNTLGGPMTFWFGSWMGDADNMSKYIYEGNLVLTGTQMVPLPATLFLIGLGVSRRRI